MNDFITIAIFTLPSEMVVAKAKLESEDIHCRVLDELTVQSYNFISNAIGGIKLQVLKEEIPRAMEILKDGGFISSEDVQASYIDKQLSDPKTIKKIRAVLFILFGLIAIIVILFVFIRFN